MDPYNCASVAPDGKWQSGQCTFQSNFFCMARRKLNLQKLYIPHIHLEPEEVCIEDTSCTATTTSCVDFEECINKNGALEVLSGTNSTCNAVTVQCTDPNAIPANNGGTTGQLKCICDGKNPCEWQSDDFVGEITEDAMCITDHTCPVS